MQIGDFTGHLLQRVSQANNLMRLNKFLAQAGVASRRRSEWLISAGEVTINGVMAESPAVQVQPEDEVRVSGEQVYASEQVRLWRYYKPVGLLCTNYDAQDRPIIFEYLPESLGRVVTVGRLDMNSEGLLLLSNHGAFAGWLEHPAQGLERTYRVRIRGVLSDNALHEMQDGVCIDEVQYRPAEVVCEHVQRSNSWIRMTLREGKNREIRRICEHFGHEVSRLIRVSYAGISLESLETGGVEEVQGDAIEELVARFHAQNTAKNG